MQANNRRYLENIMRRAGHILKRVDYVSPSPPLQVRIPMTLPEPTPIADLLVRAGWKRDAAEELSNAYVHFTRKIKSEHEQITNNAIDACLKNGSPEDVQAEISCLRKNGLEMYRQALVHCTNRTLQLSEQRMRELVSRPDTTHISEKSGIRSPYKYASIILEKAFSLNPYPVRSEKEALANHTGLNYKQVHVWFQNRRNRAKREGGVVSKLTFVGEYDDFAQLLRGEVERNVTVQRRSTMKVYLEPSASEASDSPTISQSCLLQVDRSPHAFPNTFPPVCDYDPFPILHGPQTFDTPWPRRAATGSNKGRSNTATNQEHLCAPLSRLSLTDGLLSRGTQGSIATNRTRRLCEHVPTCFPVLVRPPTAPLPALIPAAVAIHAVTATHVTSSPPLSLSRHVVAQTPSITTTRQASTAKSTVAPERIPHSLPKQARYSAHPYQPRKSPESKTRHGRLPRLSSASSMSSLTSDDSCSSRASSASLESPPPSTPPPLPLVLPIPIKVFAPDIVLSPSQDFNRLFDIMDPSRHCLLTPHQIQVVQQG